MPSTLCPRMVLPLNRITSLISVSGRKSAVPSATVLACSPEARAVWPDPPCGPSSPGPGSGQAVGLGFDGAEFFPACRVNLTLTGSRQPCRGWVQRPSQVPFSVPVPTCRHVGHRWLAGHTLGSTIVVHFLEGGMGIICCPNKSHVCLTHASTQQTEEPAMQAGDSDPGLLFLSRPSVVWL